MAAPDPPTIPSSLAASFTPIVSSTVAIVTAYLSLSYIKHQYRLTALVLISTFALLAFYHSNTFTPDSWINFVFARYQLIFLAHQAFLHCVISPENLLEERKQWRSQHHTIKTASHISSEESKNAQESKALDSHDGASRNGKERLVHEDLSPDWLFGYKMLWNPMGVNTSWEVGRTRAAEATGNTSQSMEKTRKISNHMPTAGAVYHPRDRIHNQASYTERPHSQTKASLERCHDQATPSRRSFVCWCLLRLLARYIALCIIYDPLFHFRMPYDKPITADDYSLSNRYFIATLVPHVFRSYRQDDVASSTSTVLSHALALRSHHILHLLTTENLVLSSYHDMLAILFVGILRLDSPSEWPPLYGNIMQAYTVRRFWAKYWHLLIYRSFSGLIGLALKQVGLSKQRAKAQAARLLHNGLVFVASGLMHVMVQWVQSEGECWRCGCWGIFWWFVLHIVGITIEEVVLDSVKWLLKRHSELLCRWGVSEWFVRRAGRIMGYLWVLSWLNWTTEVTEFPSLHCNMLKPLTTTSVRYRFSSILSSLLGLLCWIDMSRSKCLRVRYWTINASFSKVGAPSYYRAGDEEIFRTSRAPKEAIAQEYTAWGPSSDVIG